MKKCMQCGHENDDASGLCVCGQDLSSVPAASAGASAAAEVLSPAETPVKEPRLVLRKLLFVLGTLALVAAYGLLRYRVKTDPLWSSLLVSGVWLATAVAGLWFLGRERQPKLCGVRILLVVVAALLLPQLLNVTDGLVEYGWPTGRFNRAIARVLTLIIPMASAVFLTGLVTHIRTYRVAGVLALLSGVTSIVLGVYLIPATRSFLHRSIVLGDVLNNIMFVAKVETYAAIPLGVVLIFGGILLLFGARARVS